MREVPVPLPRRCTSSWAATAAVALPLSDWLQSGRPIRRSNCGKPASGGNGESGAVAVNAEEGRAEAARYVWPVICGMPSQSVPSARGAS